MFGEVAEGLLTLRPVYVCYFKSYSLIGYAIHCMFTTRQLLREYHFISIKTEFTFDIERVTMSTTLPMII